MSHTTEDSAPRPGADPGATAGGRGSGAPLGSPEDLLGRTDLSREDKVEMLHQWEADLREGMVAEEENMPAPEPTGADPRVNLDQVLDALRALGARSRFEGVPTKHG